MPDSKAPLLLETASDNLLCETLPSLVPAIYGHYKAFVFSRLITLFHTVQRGPSMEFIDSPSIPQTAARPVTPNCHANSSAKPSSLKTFFTIQACRAKEQMPALAGQGALEFDKTCNLIMRAAA
jgi:hypothetical protein